MVRECISEAWAAAAMTCLISLMPLMTAENSMKLAWVVSAMILARVVLPTPGGPQKIMEPAIVALDLHAQGLAGADQVLLAAAARRGVRGRMRSARGAVREALWGLRVRRRRGSSRASQMVEVRRRF